MKIEKTPNKVEKISAMKLANLLSKKNIREATALRKYDYFTNLLKEIVGGKSNIKNILECVFKGLDDAMLTNPKDSKMLLQSILEVLVQHVSEPEQFLKSFSFTKVSQNGEKGFFLKVENKFILLDRFFSEDFMPKGIFENENAADLKLNLKTIQLIIHKVQCLKVFQQNEIKDLSQLQAGDIVIFVRNKRQSQKIDAVGRAISFLNSLANPHAVFGHNRSTHAGIIVQGKEISTIENPVKEEDVHIAHVIKNGFTKQPLKEYFDQEGGEKRTLFVFRPKHKVIAQNLVSSAIQDENHGIKWKMKSGALAIFDKSKGAKIPKKQLSDNTVCSKFVAQCMKKSLFEFSKVEKHKIAEPINSNITPKKLEHWLISHIDMFEPCIYFGDRKTEKTIHFKQSKKQIIENQIKQLKKSMSETKIKNYFRLILAEIRFEIAEKELKLEKLKLLQESFLNIDIIGSAQETKEEDEKGEDSKRISYELNPEQVQSLMIEKSIRLIKHEIQAAKLEYEIGLFHHEDQHKRNDIIPLKEKFEIEKKKVRQCEKDLQQFKENIKNIESFSQVNKPHLIESDFDEHKRRYLIALVYYKIDLLKVKINSIHPNEKKQYFVKIIRSLLEAMDEDIEETSTNYYEEILKRLLSVESELRFAD